MWWNTSIATQDGTSLVYNCSMKLDKQRENKEKFYNFICFHTLATDVLLALCDLSDVGTNIMHQMRNEKDR